MGFSIQKTNIKDYLLFTEQNSFYSCGYYSQNCWVDDNRLVLSRTKKSSDKESSVTDFILVDLNDKTEKVLLSYEGASNTAHVVFKNTLYYVEDAMLLCSLDVDTLERKEIYRAKDEPIRFPHMTADGRYMNWFYEGNSAQKDIWTCYRIDLETGEIVKMVEKAFLPPFKVANHFMICPTNPDIMFFAHEGDTTYITNRLWIAEKGKEPYNIAKQRLDNNGNLIDCFGHESWAADGKGLYFVKYACSPEPPWGVGYVDLQSREARILYTKYKCWHVCAAPNGRYLAADLAPEKTDVDGVEQTGICLIDMKNNTEIIIANVNNHKKHPGHPHPQFNPSCKRICFHHAIDMDTLAVGIIDI